ncbi:MAG: hypothetical protein CMP67_07985 [Flavobacteriales bacterium]|nr:hypothetical protein [Flavobacteriales bacterium]|tara:strand:+ start:382 stop:1284 length:903 start_codon:yes stop_codon:yes gene_type:complete
MSKENSEKILILGAGGFIGKNLFDGFKGEGLEVVGSAQSGNFIRLNILIDDWKKIILNENPTVIINCIAYGNSQNHQNNELIKVISYDFPRELIKFCHEKMKLKAFIQLGSSSEYGLNCCYADEGFDLKPNSEYSLQKGRLSEFVHQFAYEYNFPVIYFRLFSVYGDSESEMRLIPTLLREAKKGKFPNLGSKEISRDFVHVDDVIEVIKLGIESINFVKGSIFNICSGKKITLLQLCEIVKYHFKIKRNPIFDTRPNHSWDIKDWYGNSQKAQKILGWEPKMSLEDYFQEEFKKAFNVK